MSDQAERLTTSELAMRFWAKRTKLVHSVTGDDLVLMADAISFANQCRTESVQAERMTQDVDLWIKELTEAGWKRHATQATVWISPAGGWYRGPYGAWCEMKGVPCQSAQGIVSWCRGDKSDEFIVAGVQHMMDRYAEVSRDALHKLCPICEHEWRRHDPEDGKCDAGPPCGCGRNLEGMQARIAQLSKAALAGMPAPKPEPVDMPRIQDAAAKEEQVALHKRVQELSDALEDLHDAIEARADSGKRRALTVSPKMEKSLLKARAALKRE